MTKLSKIAGLLLFSAWSQAALAEPGYRWEMTMEMNGMTMPGMGGGNSQCLPAKRSGTPGMDSKECTLLESSQKGNTYHWKARCQGSVSTGDFTYLGETAYKGTVTMEEGGEKMVMKMSGKRGAKCEYNEPKIVMPDMKPTCDEAVRGLEPSLIFQDKALCANRKPDFCAQLATLSPEKFAHVADRVANEAQLGPMPGMVRMEAALKHCGVRLASLQEQQCHQAVSGKDCDFIDRYCPNDKARCLVGRAFSGRAYTGRDYTVPAQGGGNGGGGMNPLGQGLNQLKGLFGF